MSETITTEKVEDIEIRLLLEAPHCRYHYDFRNYAMASLKRRLKQAREQLAVWVFLATGSCHGSSVPGTISRQSNW